MKYLLGPQETWMFKQGVRTDMWATGSGNKVAGKGYTQPSTSSLQIHCQETNLLSIPVASNSG